jgi:hypothetical protein
VAGFELCDGGFDCAESRSSELISNSTSNDGSNNACVKGRLETVSPSGSTELQWKRRLREGFCERAASDGAEVVIKMLQTRGVGLSPNLDKEPFASGSGGVSETATQIFYS